MAAHFPETERWQLIGERILLWREGGHLNLPRPCKVKQCRMFLFHEAFECRYDAKVTPLSSSSCQNPLLLVSPPICCIIQAAVIAWHVTAVRYDSLINRVRFPRDSHYFKTRGKALWGCGEAEWRRRGVADCWGMVELNLLLSSDAVHKQRNRGTSEVLALNQVGENWQ